MDGILCVSLMFLGWGYLPFFTCRQFLRWLAREQLVRNPWTLFIAGVIFIAAQALIAAALIFIMLYPSEFQSRVARGIAGNLIILASGCGMALWAFSLLTRRFSPTKEQRMAALKKLGAARFQIWLQDILIAIVIAGAGLAALSNYTENESRAVWLILELINASWSFFIVLEVLRATPFASIPGRRAALMSVMMLVALIPGIFLIEAIAWVATMDVLGLLEAERKD